MDLGSLVYSVGQLIGIQMDTYVSSQRPRYESGTLRNVVSSNIPKARLLYYFSFDEMKGFNIDPNQREDSWCGWHNDHSALTGLILG